ncbi:MAG: tetratricopeptide repeat protein [Acidobacteria bacterium]|nr:tetratricopeptide repeat protein [Acidobacteriota bacterium]
MGEAAMTARMLVAFVAVLAWHGCRAEPTGPSGPVVTDEQMASLEPSARTALESAREALRKLSQDPETHGRLAVLLHAHGFLEAAAASYGSAQALAPDDARWYRLDAHRAAEAGKETEALAKARRAVEADAESVAARTTLAELELRRGRLEESRNHFHAALEGEPGNVTALRGMATLAFRSGDHGEAAHFAERGLAVAPDDPNLHYTAALAFERLGESARAREHLAASRRGPARRPAIEPPPEIRALRGGGARAALAAGTELLDQGRYEEAILALTAAAETDPESADAHNALGAAFEQAGRPEDARLRYERAVELEPDLAAARGNLGVLLGRLGDLDGALQHLEAAVRLDSGRADAHIALGAALEASGRTADAVAAFRNALARDPALGRAHLRLGVLLGEAGQLEDALFHLREASALEPESGEAHHYLSVALLRLGDTVAALEQERRAVALAEAAGDADLLGTARYTLGMLLREAGNLTEALESLEAARSRFPRNTDLLAELAHTRHLAGEHGTAIEIQTQVVAARPLDAEAHYRLGVFFAAGGDRTAARRAFEASLRVQPGFAPAAQALDRLNRER